jgi:hypothetical protein
LSPGQSATPSVSQPNPHTLPPPPIAHKKKAKNQTNEYNAGPQVFLDRDAPRYFIAFGVHLGCYVCLTIAIIFLRFWLVLQNKKKDRVLAESGLSSENNLTHAFEDRTDQENLHFRYIY